MAAGDVIAALLLVAVGLLAYRMYSQLMQTLREVEERQVAPVVAQVNARIAHVTHQTERLDSAIRSTMDRVDETAGRVRESVAHRVHRVLGLVNGTRSAFEKWFNRRRASGEAPGYA